MTVYSALYSLLKANLKLPLVRSGHIEDMSKSYVILNKISNTLDTLDSCLRRLDQNIFQIDVFTPSMPDLLEKLGIIETVIENKTLSLSTKRFVSLLYNGSNVRESTVGFYHGFLTYEIMTQKEFDANFQTNRVSAKNLFEALFTQYNNSILLNNKLNGFTTSKFGKENWKRPFLFIPDYKITEDFRTSCLTRMENYEFSISVEDNDPDEIERILEEVDNTYSYMDMNLTEDRRFTNLQWIGDSLVELEPDLWLGTVNYNLLVEKSQ